jgi:hypothetical protein
MLRKDNFNRADRRLACWTAFMTMRPRQTTGESLFALGAVYENKARCISARLAHTCILSSEAASESWSKTFIAIDQRYAESRARMAATV